MATYTKFYPLLVSALISVFISCNDSTEKTNTHVNDTTETPRSADMAFYDSSRSVTTISPNLYKQLYDTLNIRVIEGVYKPGDSSIMHAHPDFALYVLEGSTVELTMGNGNKQNLEFKKGMAVVLPAAVHSAKNIGKSTLRLIVVEVNRPRS